jgi:hypothetical protein
MRRVEAILVAALAISLAGCVVRGKPKAAAAVPPAPKPAPSAPAAPPQPLSIPQTQVQLPPPQPVNPEALPSEPPTEPPAETTSTTTRGNRGRPAVSHAPRPETAAPPAAAPAPVAEPRAPMQEVVPAGEQKRWQDSAQARKREIQKWLDTAGRQRLTSHQRNTVERIRAFLKDSDDAERRGDMREADALAERAQILLRELQNAQ